MKYLGLKNKRGSLYSKIVFSFTISTVLTILILSSVVYINFESIGSSLLYSSSRESLVQASYSINYMVKSAKSLAMQAYYDEQISKLLFYPSLSSVDTEAPLNQLSYYRYANGTFVHSIYVFNRRAGKFYIAFPSNINAIQSADTFFDKDIVNIVDNIKPYQRFAIIPRQIPMPIYGKDETPPSNVYTFMFYDLTNGPRLDSAVILNISEDWIRDVMNSMNVNSDNDTFIIDNKGTLVTGSKKHDMFYNESKEGYISTVLSQKDSSGYFISTVDGVKALVTYVDYAPLGWRFVRVTPYASLIKNLRGMKNWMILICLLILIAGFSASYATSRRLYKPIDNLLNRSRTLEREKRESLSTLKQEFLRSLLKGSSELGLDGVQKKFDEMGINLKAASQMRMLLFKIDYYADFCNRFNVKDRNLLKFAAMNIAAELCSNAGIAADTAATGEDHFALLMNTTEPSPDLAHLAANIQQEAQRHLELSLSAAVSRPAGAADDLGAIYDETLEVSNYRLFQGHGCILEAGEGSNIRDTDFTYPADKEDMLVEALLLGKTNDVKGLFDEIINAASRYYYSAFDLTLMRLSSAIYTAIETFRRNMEMTVSTDFPTFMKGLNKAETIDEVRERFFTLFDSLGQQLVEKKSMKYDKLVNRVLGIIREGYHDPNLSLNTVAESASMSPVYLGRLFKKLTAKSVSDQINEVRLEAAKSLLDSSSLPINEITAQVGITNNPYFYTMFRKKYGVTPNEYRQTASGS